MKKHFFVFILLFFSTFAIAQKKSKKDYLVTLNTKFGTMHMVLFDDTPLHKANFVKLVEQKFYDSLLFHRIIDGFMIQGGDPNSKNAKPGERLGNGGGNLERIPFEFKPNHIHRKGALAAARDNNPEKKSSACQFYIVQGKKRTDEEITTIAQRNGMNYTTEQRADYMILGGTPHLDNGYTVFGEVIDNLNVIDEIAKQPKDSADRPKEDIKMDLKVKKMRKKKITKKFGYKY
ncbi:peptidyl-prolyl cis-trans isomerase cyclophilin type [Emticicia oligotrophica DSM 17448]|uniref:peptidylprolyl isomerase n=1 Tax=Emticicia oligotrophica (strain DSM 17448 / CIP 109782 / MTCC 6937 / GPTSA100-15) TaxID=929562 RepID=A0ABM5N0C6_EMTOG|nr:peptidylprolyl isomerase [Emticicia oligotrophica]AFK02811.1 peptidyl-prolyl cis-trans isomerase cyclophilin type [Emticicia oligotrophica DSM 17448]